jgi:hypothetical protein
VIHEDKYFEFWYDEINEETCLPHYLLVLIPDQINPGMVVVLDPQKNNEVVFRGRDYEDASNWLVEDEFQQLEGRVVYNDGWPEPGSPNYRTK